MVAISKFSKPPHWLLTPTDASPASGIPVTNPISMCAQRTVGRPCWNCRPKENAGGRRSNTSPGTSCEICRTEQSAHQQQRQRHDRQHGDDVEDNTSPKHVDESYVAAREQYRVWGCRNGETEGAAGS